MSNITQHFLVENYKNLKSWMIFVLFGSSGLMFWFPLDIGKYKLAKAHAGAKDGGNICNSNTSDKSVALFLFFCSPKRFGVNVHCTVCYTHTFIITWCCKREQVPKLDAFKVVTIRREKHNRWSRDKAGKKFNQPQRFGLRQKVESKSFKNTTITYGLLYSMEHSTIPSLQWRAVMTI